MASVYPGAWVTAAEIAGKAPIMDRTAESILRRARAEAAKHRLTGATIANMHVETTKSGKDRLIVADGEGIVPIEFGYVRMKKVGRRVTAVVVPGLRIMRNAYASIPARG